MKAIIEIENLTHIYSDKTIGLKDINLNIFKGEFVVIAGPNGSGKTTLLKHLNGLLLPHKGIIRIEGLNIVKNLLLTRQTVGMIFQDSDSQIIGETVYDDVAFGPENLSLNKKEIDERVCKALKITGLSELSSKKTHLLSGGEKKRLTIAGVLAMNPEILVFDEPFSNLDYFGTKQILKEIIHLHQAGYTILLATHDLEKVISFTNRIIILRYGSVVIDDNPVKIIKKLESYGIREPFTSISWID